MTAVLETPLALTTTVIPLTLTLRAPLHHGAGTAGNTQILRTQEIVLPDGTPTVVPYVSGSSLRHEIRQAAADHLLASIEAPPGSLRKPVVDLLYSGGVLTSSGSNVDLDVHRRLTELWPALSLLGYAGRSNIWSGVLSVDHVHLVCSDNAWRLPAHLANHPHASLPAAAARDEDFGTRHDILGGPPGRWVEADLWTGTTTQMIFDWQVIRAGSVMHTALRLTNATEGHIDALTATWSHMADPDGCIHLAAKRAQGYGLCHVDLPHGAPETATAGVVYRDRLREHGAEILTLLDKAAGA